jgi:hypothetical protein
LPQRHVERRLQRVVEYRIARTVGKIGENNGVFVGQALALPMRSMVVKKSGSDQRDQTEDQEACA